MGADSDSSLGNWVGFLDCQLEEKVEKGTDSLQRRDAATERLQQIAQYAQIEQHKVQDDNVNEKEDVWDRLGSFVDERLEEENLEKFWTEGRSEQRRFAGLVVTDSVPKGASRSIRRIHSMRNEDHANEMQKQLFQSLDLQTFKVYRDEIPVMMSMGYGMNP